MNKVQQAISTHKSLFIFGGVLMAGLWFGIIGKSMFENNKKTAPANPGIVAVQSHTSSATLPTTEKSRRAIIPMHAQHHTAAVTTSSHNVLPKAKMSSTSMRLHETSDAKAQVIGSGVGTATGNGISSSNQTRGIHSTALSYGGNMMALSSSLALAAPGASQANEVAEVLTTPTKVHRAKKVDDDPLDPFLDPVGDVVWPLMILLAAGYAFFCYRRRTRA